MTPFEQINVKGFEHSNPKSRDPSYLRESTRARSPFQSTEKNIVLISAGEQTTRDRVDYIPIQFQILDLIEVLSTHFTAPTKLLTVNGQLENGMPLKVDDAIDRVTLHRTLVGRHGVIVQTIMCTTIESI
jgi:hypothetical protein